MHVDVAWSITASRQFKALSRSQQRSTLNVVSAIKISPRAAHYYSSTRKRDDTMHTIWVAYSLEVRVLFTLSEHNQQLLARIIDVAPTDLPSVTDYEESQH